MVGYLFPLRARMVCIGFFLLVSCAPPVTTVGTTPTTPPTSTAPPLVQVATTPTTLPEIEVGVVEVDLLNIREGPGTNFPILGSLAKGEKFYVLGEVHNSTGNKWLLISPSEGSFGWVIGDQTYVNLQKEIVDLSTYLIWQNNIETAKLLLTALTPTPQ